MEQQVNISMDASTIIEAIRGKGLNGVPRCSLSDCSMPIPSNQQLTMTQLSPRVPILSVSSKREAFHPQLQKTCLKYPITIIRDLTKVLELDLSLFSTETVVKIDPHRILDLRKQMKSESDKNWNKTKTKMTWTCISTHDSLTMRSYAEYQTKYLENQNKSNQENTGDSFSIQASKDKEDRHVKFATNIDISNGQWSSQLEELEKLPPFFKVTSRYYNILDYVGYKIFGMNTVQLYMKVPGCRTTGHQENNNFCSININIGPGDCEWFAVPYEYWDTIRLLCEQNDIDYMLGSWWPANLNVLYMNNIPVYRFLQKAGDVVWVNVGCVHWVQAVGCCNNIAWNFGPFIPTQYQLAMERYEWNKLHHYHSIVPMVNLTWNLACDATVFNSELVQLIKNCLLQTMKQNYLTLEYLRHKGVRERDDSDCATDCIVYCCDCDVEIFNLVIYSNKKKGGKYIAYCIHCAIEQSSLLTDFSYSKKYHIEQLMNIYDQFKFICNQ